MSGFGALIMRDIRLALRDGGAIGTALGFYLIVVSLIPLAVGPDLKLLGKIAPGVLWVALMLSALLSLGRVFEADFEDGSLDVLASGSLPLEMVAAAKSLAHWVTTGVPLVIMAPVLGMLLNLDLDAVPMVMATMLVGTIAISFFGAIAAALTLRSRRSGVLIAIMVLPLYIPTLIYGVTTIAVTLTPPGSPWPSFMLLSAISLVSLVMGPWAAAAALRHQMQ
ncbi:MAG: heme exporter protein CcmB [Hyphomicrobiaceae bacterium]